MKKIKRKNRLTRSHTAQVIYERHAKKARIKLLIQIAKQIEPIALIYESKIKTHIYPELPKEKPLISKRRTNTLANARQLLYYLIREHGYSYPEIGAYVKRDHTTVLFGVKKIEKKLSRDLEFKTKVEKIK